LHFGSMILGSSPAASSYFFNADLLIPESEVVAALRGEITSPAMPDPTDVRQLQGGASVTLKRGKSTEFWIAIVAGESRAEILANAAAAVADGNARRGSKDLFAVTPGTMEPQVPANRAGMRSGTARGAKKVCKADCAQDLR
jgi:hypothetical protein